MNVAIFTDNDFDKVNGVTTTLTAALRCAPPGVTLRIYTAGTLPVDAPDYLALRSLSLPIPFYSEMRMYVPRLFDYVRRARQDRIDVLHLTTPGPIGLATLYVARRLSLPIVGSFHTDLAAYTTTLSGSPRLGQLMRQYMRWPYSRCRRVLVPSEHTRELLAEAGTDRNRLHVWSRGVDTELFSPVRRSAALRESWHVGERRAALLYVGRLSREKGLHLLAPISERLHAIGVEHRWILAGQGPMERELRASLPDAMFTGVLTRDEVAVAFASSDLLVFPSRTDTAGNVVLEGQASGIPVVVSGDGGPRENMVAGVTGLVCHREDPREWSDTIASLLRAPVRRLSMAGAARDYAATRGWSRALEPLYRAYRDAAAADAATAPPPVMPIAAQRV